MPNICDNCGLPPDLCVCESLAKESEKIRIVTEKRRFGKEATMIFNVKEDMNPKQITTELKKKLACGGTYKNGIIELQGNHKRRAKEILMKLGFAENQIEG